MSRILWARRFLLFGVLMLAACYVLYDWGDLYGPLLADSVVATGDTRIAVLSDEQIQQAFQRAVAATKADAVLFLLNADDHGRKYEVHVTAPDRDTALAQTEALLTRFGAECGGQPENMLWKSVSAYAQPLISPVAGLWLGRIKTGLVVGGLMMLAAGGLLYIPRGLLGGAGR